MIVIELLVLFFLLPTLFFLGRFRVPAIPMLWILMAYCLCVLWRQGKLSLITIAPTGIETSLPSIFIIFFTFAIIVTILVYRHAPRDLFSLVRTKPAFWAVVMVAYPLLSVYPQGIIFRAFFFERYRSLFPAVWLMVLMSTLAFGYIHIVFRNWIALLLSAIGGLLFALRYAQTGSLCVSSFEHALYGCWLFTVGLGRWFFYGAQSRGD